MQEQCYDYARRAAKALMVLRGLSIREVSASTGIGEPVLTWFLGNGADAALSDESFEALFAHLGVVATEEGARLAPTRVHYLHVNVAIFRRHVGLFRLLAPLMDGSEARVLPKHRKCVPVLVRGKSVRLVLLVKGSVSSAVPIAKYGLTPAAPSDDQTRSPVPAYCLELVLTGQVKRRYFDLIFNGRTQLESVELLRMAGLDRDITLTEILGAVLRERRDDSADDGAGCSREAQRRLLRIVPAHFDERVAA